MVTYSVTAVKNLEFKTLC